MIPVLPGPPVLSCTLGAGSAVPWCRHQRSAQRAGAGTGSSLCSHFLPDKPSLNPNSSLEQKHPGLVLGGFV